jgi:hypothetical protein
VLEQLGETSAFVMAVFFTGFGTVHGCDVVDAEGRVIELFQVPAPMTIPMLSAMLVVVILLLLLLCFSSWSRDRPPTTPVVGFSAPSPASATPPTPPAHLPRTLPLGAASTLRLTGLGVVAVFAGCVAAVFGSRTRTTLAALFGTPFVVTTSALLVAKLQVAAIAVCTVVVAARYGLGAIRVDEIGGLAYRTGAISSLIVRNDGTIDVVAHSEAPARGFSLTRIQLDAACAAAALHWHEWANGRSARPGHLLLSSGTPAV